VLTVGNIIHRGLLRACSIIPTCLSHHYLKVDHFWFVKLLSRGETSITEIDIGYLLNQQNWDFYGITKDTPNHLWGCPLDGDLSGARGHCVGVVLIFSAHTKVRYLDDVIISYQAVPGSKITMDAVLGFQVGHALCGEGVGSNEAQFTYMMPHSPYKHPHTSHRASSWSGDSPSSLGTPREPHQA
jgi:hypothetical protein